MKKVLILTTEFGKGHISVSEHLENTPFDITDDE
jgi:hypothetical protein